MVVISAIHNKLFVPKEQFEDTYYPYYKFNNCENLDAIEVESGHPHLYSANNCLIYRKGLKMTLGCRNSECSAYILAIEYPAFNKCKGLNNIVISDSVERIGYSSFAGSDLKSIKLSKSLINIEQDAFRDCTSLANIEFFPYIEKIGDNAFYGCSNILKIDLPDSIQKIGHHAFGNCSNLEDVHLPNALKKIPTGLFQGCTNLKRVNIPDKIEFMSAHSFENCSSLEAIKLSKNNDKIRSATFFGCSKLKFIEIPFGTKEIQSRAFRGCHSLNTIYIPSSVNKIASDAFEWVKYSSNTDYSLTIYSAAGSYAEMFAKRNGYDFVAIPEDNAYPLICPERETEIVLNANYCHNCGKKIKTLK